MECCAGPCWGTGPSSERKKRREEERTERLFMFHLELPSTGDPWTTPPGSCVACGRSHTHTYTHIYTQYTQLLLDPSIQLEQHFKRSRSPVASVVTCFMVVAEAAEVYSRPTLAAFRAWLVCLFYELSRAAAFAGIVSSHTVLTQHCL